MAGAPYSRPVAVPRTVPWARATSSPARTWSRATRRSGRPFQTWRTDVLAASQSTNPRVKMRSYQTAKLAVTTWIYGLARRWSDRGVTANLLDPGIVKGKSGSEHFEGPALTGVLMSHVIPFFVAAGKKHGSSLLSLDPAIQQRIDDTAQAWAAPFLCGR